jgi:hypothetical protein
VDAGAFLFEDAGSVIERQDVGEDIMIMCRGLGVASFRRGDGVGRDVAIASLLRLGLGLKTDAVAELCGASHGWVCDVRARLKEGGMESVIARGKRGRRRRIVGRTEDTLREMRAAGATLGDIAKALGVSESLCPCGERAERRRAHALRPPDGHTATADHGGWRRSRRAPFAVPPTRVRYAARGMDALGIAVARRTSGFRSASVCL